MSLVPEEQLRAYVDYLRDMGVYDLYRRDEPKTVLPEGSRELLVEALQTGVDAATFASSSSVRNLAEVAREAGIGFPLTGESGLVAGCSIGPVTSATMREFGWEPAGEAAASDLPGLIDAVRQGLGNRG